MSTAPKVEYGIKNVHYAVWTDPVGSTPGSYATPVALPGAVSLSLEWDGDSNKFYADNIPYFTVSSNSGGSGSLEVARIDKAFKKAILGCIEDANQMIIDVANATRPQFALLFEVATDQDPIKFVLYNCTAKSPNRTDNTATDSTDPDTITVEFDYAVREFAYGTGTTIEATMGALELDDTQTTGNKSEYDAFYSAVLEPEASA